VHLNFLSDVSNYIIGKAVGVRGFLVVRVLVPAVGGPELVEVVIGEVLLRGASVLAACGDGGSVVGAEDVPDEVIVVGNVLDGAAAGLSCREHAQEPAESPGAEVVVVGGGDAVSVLDPLSLPELVIGKALDVNILVSALGAVGFSEQSSVVVAVGEDLTVGVGHLGHAAEGVEKVEFLWGSLEEVHFNLRMALYNPLHYLNNSYLHFRLVAVQIHELLMQGLDNLLHNMDY